MIDKKDWETVYQDLLRDERARLGELPPVEELIAYTEGALPQERAERIRELLAVYPELARDLGRPLPEPQPGDLDYATDKELEESWARLEAKLPSAAAAADIPAGGRRHWRIGWSQAANLVAAVLVVALGSHDWGRHREIERLKTELQTPEPNPEIRRLVPDGRRGGSDLTILRPGKQRFYLLQLAVIDEDRYPDYQLRILHLVGGDRIEVWKTSGLQRRKDIFEIRMPRSFLSSGEHRFELYGVSEAGTENLLATYTVRLMGPPK